MPSQHCADLIHPNIGLPVGKAEPNQTELVYTFFTSWFMHIKGCEKTGMHFLFFKHNCWPKTTLSNCELRTSHPTTKPCLIVCPCPGRLQGCHPFSLTTFQNFPMTFQGQLMKFPPFTTYMYTKLHPLVYWVKMKQPSPFSILPLCIYVKHIELPRCMNCVI